MPKLVVATRNLDKLQEIREILGNGWELITLRDLPGAPEIVEDAHTFAGNATKKAVGLARWLQSCGQPAEGSALPETYVMADDSGLEVDALHGAPGVHSARFAASPERGHFGQSVSDPQQRRNTPDAENNALLLSLLADVSAERRTARFRCVIALTPLLAPRAETASPVCDADELELQTRIFEGACEGTIAFAPTGRGGFGYDPLFIPRGFNKSFAELGADVKNGLSHRARALALAKNALGV